MLKITYILLSHLLKLNTVTAFTNIQTLCNHQRHHSLKQIAFYNPKTKQYAKPKNQWMNSEEPIKKEEIKRPVNEFSRVVRVDSVLSSGTSASSRKARNYSVFIEAKPEELDGLAKRFQLPEISKLEADLVLRKDSGTKSGSSSKGELIQAEGTVAASLSQICIRTNVPFETDLNFELFAAVRTSGSRDDISNITPTKSTSNFRSRKNNKRSNRQKINLSNAVVDDLSMQEIQGMLEDIDLEDDVIEDDAVFNNGNLDVGELVAQMFRLKLDPFPKKPGTKPVDMTFTG